MYCFIIGEYILKSKGDYIFMVESKYSPQDIQYQDSNIYLVKKNRNCL